METLKKLSVVTNNFEELKEKVLELTKNDFSWALECNIEDKDGHVVNTKLLILSDFKYDIEDEDSNYKALTVKVTYERYLAEEIYNMPIFLTDYPKDIKAFYMRNNNDGKTVAATDLLVPGIGELVGGSQREERLDILLKKTFHLFACFCRYFF